MSGLGLDRSRRNDDVNVAVHVRGLGRGIDQEGVGIAVVLQPKDDTVQNNNLIQSEVCDFLIEVDIDDNGVRGDRQSVDDVYGSHGRRVQLVGHCNVRDKEGR